MKGGDSIINEIKELNKAILFKNEIQHSKKGNNYYVLNVELVFHKQQLRRGLEADYKLPTEKLQRETELYLNGIEDTATYRDAGITWWDYVGNYMVNSYPQHFAKAKNIFMKVKTGLKKGKQSRNWFIDLNTVGPTSQHACISYIQLQNKISADNKSHLVVTVYQRSADVSIGLPCDIYQVQNMIEKYVGEIDTLHWYIGNAHIYENNMEATRKWLDTNERQKYIQNTGE